MKKALLCGSLAALFITSGAKAALPDYSRFELQARSNLLVNDNGYNLPPGAAFNSVSADINASAQVAFRMGVVPDASDPAQSRPGIWLGAHGTGELVYTGSIPSERSAIVTSSHPRSTTAAGLRSEPGMRSARRSTSATAAGWCGRSATPI